MAGYVRDVGAGQASNNKGELLRRLRW
jgi:hypothetical protein